MGYCLSHRNHLKTHSVALYPQVLRGSLLKRGNKIAAGLSLFPSFPWIWWAIWGIWVQRGKTLSGSLWASKYTHYMITKAICLPRRLSQTLLMSNLLLTPIKCYCNFCKVSKLLYFEGILIRSSVTFSCIWAKNTFSGINNSGTSPPSYHWYFLSCQRQ